MKIAVAQNNFTVGDLEGNKEKIIESIKAARKQNAELVVFPEYAISGTPCYDLLREAPFHEACQETLREIATHCEGISVLVGLPIQERNIIMYTMSAAAFIQDGRIVKFIGKSNVYSRTEQSFIGRSRGMEYVEVGDKKIAVVVGDDLQIERAFGDYADLVVALSSDPFARGQIAHRFDWCSSLSYTVGKPLVYVNHMGGQSDFVGDGTSFVMDDHGRAIAILKSFEEDFAVVDMDSRDFVELPKQNRAKNSFEAIKLGLGDYFRKNGFTKACLGMSGGIDSAVVLAMAAEVLDPKNIKVLMMPSQFSSDHSISDSIKMVETLGVDYEIIPIEPAFNAVTGSLAPILNGTKFDVTEENIQSRLRCVMLMALSNKQGYIVLNTSNKSEAAVGYGTLYGDMSGAIGPIGDLYKVEVYALARYINREREIIPENIILKAPSAELRPDQKDSDSLPPYEIMDAILTRFVEEGQTLEEIIDAGFDDETVHRVAEMLKHAEYKRRQAPPPLRLSQRPFASHYILPLLNKFIL